VTAAGSSGLTPLEIATGIVLGLDPPLAPAPRNRPDAPLAALEKVIRPALERAPCLVSFSGGRDSSAVLAVAAALARREGFPLPIPATNRFPAAPETDETDWQERVVRHLGLPDWVRIEHDDELDCVGPVARRVLRRHGLLWPFNAHFHAPLVGAARGGSLLTGIGGDELLGVSPLDRVGAVLRRRARPRRRDLVRLGYALAPRPLRRVALRRRFPGTLPWLQPEAQREFRDRWIRQAAGDPLAWGRRMRRVGARRDFPVGAASLSRLGADAAVDVVHPLCHPDFARSLAALPPARRWTSRMDAMSVLFGDLLPRDVFSRSSKANFDYAFWRGPSRAFARRWDGGGVDTSIVDVDALRREWSSERPLAQSFLLLQAAWLAAEGGRSGAQRVEQAVARLR
jgi:asparagine synthetase B (glutamine-hydrolysing)